MGVIRAVVRAACKVRCLLMGPMIVFAAAQAGWREKLRGSAGAHCDGLGLLRMSLMAELK